MVEQIFTIQTLDAHLTYKGIAYPLNLRIFEAKLSKKADFSFLLNFMSSFLHEAPRLVHDYFISMFGFYLLYGDHENRSHQRGAYKKDKRKFQILTLNDPKYITFLEFFSDYVKKKTPESRLELFTKVINKGDKRRYSKDLFNKALYMEFPLESNLNESDYLIYRDNLIENYGKWWINRKNIPAGADEEQKTGIINEFSNKFNEMFRLEKGKQEFSLFLQEAESVFNLCLEMFFIEMLFELQEPYNLTEKEIKLYCFMYRRQEFFDGHIPKQERLLVEFYKSLSKEDKVLLIFAVINDDPDSLIKSLRAKFQDSLATFLKMYPIWLEIVQMDEAFEGHEKHLILSKENRFFYEKFAKENWRPSYKTNDPDDQKRKIEIPIVKRPIHEEIPGSGGDKFTLEEIIPNPNAEDAAEILIKKEIIERIIPKAIEALTEKQKIVIRGIYFENKTEEQIAKEEGVKQSAISQRKKTALKTMDKLIKANT